jgi:hypothetical protein
MMATETMERLLNFVPAQEGFRQFCLRGVRLGTKWNTLDARSRQTHSRSRYHCHHTPKGPEVGSLVSNLVNNVRQFM